MSSSLSTVAYLGATILFILCLGGLSNQETSRRGNLYGMIGMAIAVIATVFVLACFVGYMVVWNVKPALHTPLMSVTNAVSSIIAIGALVQIAPDLTKISTDLSRPGEWIRWVSVVAVALATINMFGGFAVTQRMLAMFRK
jgi:NAD/NADP transhydrogenase alpha subunit